VEVLERIDHNWRWSGGATQAVPQLIAKLSRKGQYGESVAAMWVLGRIGPPASSSVPKLMEKLDSSDPYVRSSAAKALGRIGYAAASAVPKLVEKRDDPQSDVRSLVAEALQRIRRSDDVEPIDGNFVPSGWMGDAEAPNGPLSYRVSSENPASPPSCEEWTYDPARGVLGWAAVAYQFPGGNWGDRRGMDLSVRGFTRLCFRARSAGGYPTLVVRAGGHTKPGASHPASFETDAVVIHLRPEWTSYEIPLDGDLSNVVTALVFSVRRADCDSKVTFCIDDIAFRGAGH
jgi:hypothetical protein